VRRLFNEAGAKLKELEAKKVRLFEELGRVAETQKAFAAKVRDVEREQRVTLAGIEEHTVPEGRTITHEDVVRWCESVYWSHARTMLSNPHQYVARKRCADPHMYEKVVAYVLEHGRPQVYEGHTYTVLDVEMYRQEYFLWPMTDEPSESEVLNAKPTSMAPEE
jgi:D-serine deaminase-like pyridoxal phosphate-dependent protein